MPYRFLDNIATADAAFEARGDTPEVLFGAVADALLNVMVEDIGTVISRVDRRIACAGETIEMLLLRFLEELVYLKDVKRLLLRAANIEIEEGGGVWHLDAEMTGEKIDAERHDLIVDVKAVTLHRFEVKRTDQGWMATVVVDI